MFYVFYEKLTGTRFCLSFAVFCIRQNLVPVNFGTALLVIIFDSDSEAGGRVCASLPWAWLGPPHHGLPGPTIWKYIQVVSCACCPYIAQAPWRLDFLDYQNFILSWHETSLSKMFLLHWLWSEQQLDHCFKISSPLRFVIMRVWGWRSKAHLIDLLVVRGGYSAAHSRIMA